MSYIDKVFSDTCRDIIENGIWDTDKTVRPRWEDGTPAHTVKKFGVINRYNLSKEFPLLTLRRTPWKSALDEVLWIWQKKSNNIHDLKSHVWDSWADANGSIGKAYGYQMGAKYPVKGIDLEKAKELFNNSGGIWHSRQDTAYLKRWINTKFCIEMDNVHVTIPSDYQKYGIVYMDQVDKALYDLKFNPASRRIIVTSWNPADASEMALEPCAYSMTFNVSGNKLNAILNQRSQDMLAAGAWNVCQYALLLMIFAKVSGYEPGELVHVIADCHIYDRHIPIVEELVSHTPYDTVPKVTIDPNLKNFYDASVKSIIVEGEYNYHPFDTKIEVAV